MLPVIDALEVQKGKPAMKKNTIGEPEAACGAEEQAARADRERRSRRDPPCLSRTRWSAGIGGRLRAIGPGNRAAVREDHVSLLRFEQERANAYIIGVTSGAWVVVFVWFSTAFSAAALRLRVSFAFLAASLRFFAAALRFRVSLALFAAPLRFFAAILAFLVPAALIPAARCFLVAAAFFAAALRFDPLFTVWEVYSFRHPAVPLRESVTFWNWSTSPAVLQKLHERVC